MNENPFFVTPLDSWMASNWAQQRAALWNLIEGLAYEAREALGILDLAPMTKSYSPDYFWIAGPPPMDVAEYERRHPY
jgi:hypothetical protein